MPFTIEQFLDIFKTYNHSVWPIQGIFCLLAALVMFWGVKKTSFSDRAMLGVLAFFWLWMGVVYHWFYFTSINKAAWLFGGLFVVQGGIFAWGAWRGKNWTFRYRGDIYGITGMALMVFALVVYPLLGILFGHRYPHSPTFGLPCPTTIFTFGILLWTEKKCPLYVLAVPVLWSIVGSSAAVLLGIVEDIALPVAALLASVLMVIRNRNLNNSSV